MNKKEQAELKKVIDPKHGCVIRRFYTCYVDVINNNRLHHQKVQNLLSMAEDEQEYYTAYFKKAVAGKLGTTGMQLPIDPLNEKLLTPLKEAELKDESKVHALIKKVTDVLPHKENYCVMVAFGSYDVPANKDELKVDNFEEVYRFILITVHPCMIKDVGIVFDFDRNMFMRGGKNRLLEGPQHAFLYPSFTERHTDVDTMYYTVKSKRKVNDTKRLLEEVFQTYVPASATEQKDAFQELMRSGLGESVPFDAVQKVYDDLCLKKAQQENPHDELVLTTDEIVSVISSTCNLKQEEVDKMKKTAADYSGYRFSGANIIPEKVAIETDLVNITLNVSDVGEIERRVIDGREFYLIPAEYSQIDGMTLRNNRKNR